MMVTAITFETESGEKMVSLADIVMFLFKQLPKDKQAKFLKEAEPFPPIGY
jgi:hypothetical protein